MEGVARGPGSVGAGAAKVPSGQPLYLRLLRAMLEAAGDPDREFLRQAEDGLPVGILDPLPRTPHVFEEQLENAPWEASLAWVPNYGSVEEHREFAKAKFEEDVEEGLMALHPLSWCTRCSRGSAQRTP